MPQYGWLKLILSSHKTHKKSNSSYKKSSILGKITSFQSSFLMVFLLQSKEKLFKREGKNSDKAHKLMSEKRLKFKSCTCWKMQASKKQINNHQKIKNWSKNKNKWLKLINYLIVWVKYKLRNHKLSLMMTLTKFVYSHKYWHININWWCKTPDCKDYRKCKWTNLNN